MRIGPFLSGFCAVAGLGAPGVGGGGAGRGGLRCGVEVLHGSTFPLLLPVSLEKGLKGLPLFAVASSHSSKSGSSKGKGSLTIGTASSRVGAGTFVDAFGFRMLLVKSPSDSAPAAIGFCGWNDAGFRLEAVRGF